MRYSRTRYVWLRYVLNQNGYMEIPGISYQPCFNFRSMTPLFAIMSITKKTPLRFSDTHYLSSRAVGGIRGIWTLQPLTPRFKSRQILQFLAPPHPLSVEMGFDADISLESRRNIEINVWAHTILLVFEVHYQPWVKLMPKKAKTTKHW